MSGVGGSLGLRSPAQERPIDIRAYVFATHCAARLALEGDAQIHAEAQRLAQRDDFSDVADARLAPRGEVIARRSVEVVQVREKLVHATSLPFGNALSTPFGVLPFGNPESGMAAAPIEAQEDTENRRRQLRAWIDAHYGGKQAEFVSAKKLNQGEISGLLRTKSFGSVKARKLEAQAGMPTRYLEQRAALEGGQAPGDEAPAHTTSDIKWSLSPEEEKALLALRDLPENKATARVQQIVEEAEEFRRYLRERAYERGDRRVINITPPHERRERLQSKQVPNPWGPHEPPIIDQQKREEEN